MRAPNRRCHPESGYLRAGWVATLFAILSLPATAHAFDLLPMGLTRIDGGATSPAPTPVRLWVSILNASATDMPVARAAVGWTVQIQGYASNPYIVRRALRAGERHGFAITVAVPCGKVSELEVRVNAGRSLDESSFDNNRAVFPIEGNACPVVIRSGGERRTSANQAASGAP